ncbi:hypothetical protein L228DRAFT_235443 [Xylona heveae TC161]|uniref:Uncharacterized protein n=1 Tax=Xylona heveae (strain CBS 132557 / TC161) TaxID=1328760 RepID=A0A165JKT8_XYLHT|nr:hypothetical protein L228DRAFT_235443 [Xylona heveae TC161]KZF26360.1 hypothetical protein L228DRAFT_235443 [Xylona heveae TC161]
MSAPLFVDGFQRVKSGWLLQALRFFMYHLLYEDRGLLHEQFVNLKRGQRPRPWSKQLHGGLQPLQLQWIGNHAQIHAHELLPIRTQPPGRHEYEDFFESGPEGFERLCITSQTSHPSDTPASRPPFDPTYVPLDSFSRHIQNLLYVPAFIHGLFKPKPSSASKTNSASNVAETNHPADNATNAPPTSGPATLLSAPPGFYAQMVHPNLGPSTVATGSGSGSTAFGTDANTTGNGFTESNNSSSAHNSHLNIDMTHPVVLNSPLSTLPGGLLQQITIVFPGTNFVAQPPSSDNNGNVNASQFFFGSAPPSANIYNSPPSASAQANNANPTNLADPANPQAQPTPEDTLPSIPLVPYYRFTATGCDSQIFGAHGIIHELPSQDEIPGFHRFAMLKYYPAENGEFNEADIECYEGVVIPGGQIIIGRWFYPEWERNLVTGEFRLIDGVLSESGPFLWWTVEEAKNTVTAAAPPNADASSNQ